MGQLDASIVTVALPSVQRQFSASLGGAEWTSLSYLMTLIILVVPVGRVADMLGRKLLYTYGFLLFTAASVACGLAPTLGLLVAFRVVQALGAAPAAGEQRRPHRDGHPTRQAGPGSRRSRRCPSHRAGPRAGRRGSIGRRRGLALGVPRQRPGRGARRGQWARAAAPDPPVQPPHAIRLDRSRPARARGRAPPCWGCRAPSTIPRVRSSGLPRSRWRPALGSYCTSGRPPRRCCRRRCSPTRRSPLVSPPGCSATWSCSGCCSPPRSCSAVAATARAPPGWYSPRCQQPWRSQRRSPVARRPHRRPAADRWRVAVDGRRSLPAGRDRAGNTSAGWAARPDRPRLGRVHPREQRRHHGQRAGGAVRPRGRCAQHDQGTGHRAGVALTGLFLRGHVGTTSAAAYRTAMLMLVGCAALGAVIAARRSAAPRESIPYTGEA